MDDLAQCAVGRQTVVIRKMLEAAQIITFGCDRPNLGISPTSTFCCSVVEKFVVAADPFQRHAEDSRPSSGHGWWCQACCADHEKALVKAAKRSRRLGVIRCHTKEASGLHGTNSGTAPVLELRAWTSRLPPTQGTRSRAADAICPKSCRCVTSSNAAGLPHNADPAVQVGIQRVKQWLVIWNENQRTRVPKAWRVSLEQLRTCILFDASWFLLLPRTWKEAGDAGVNWSFTEVTWLK